MPDDREQGRDEERRGAARPVSAAARRERRAAVDGEPVGATAGRPRSKAGSARPATKAAGRPAGKAGARGSANGKPANGKAVTEKKGRPTPGRDRKQARPSLWARLVRFLREVVAELRKVIWPTQKQMITYFSVVLVFLVVLVGFVFGLDLAFQKAVFAIFG